MAKPEPHPDIPALQTTARSLRRAILQMTYEAGSGHPGGSLSCIDLLTALYVGGILRFDPSSPKWPDRDRFHLSKGHAAAALYAVLAEVGYFPKDELMRFRKIDSFLQGHVDMNLVPGVEMSAGSLGQGLSVGVGMALAARLDGKDYRVWIMLGDGEIEEGQIWEAAMSAAHRKLGNLTALLDRNTLQQTDRTERTAGLEPLVAKWQAFGWEVIEIDGHDMEQILRALIRATEPRQRPLIIIAHTVKGKGVSFMEDVADFHGKAPTREELDQALAELS